MNIVAIFDTILYYPLFNALIFLYNTVAFGDLGVAIIILTILIRLILYPLSRKSIQSQKSINAISPKLKEIQKKYENNREEQAKQMLALYKENKVNPAAGCLPILIQIPILIALYRVFVAGLNPERLNGLYSFVQRPLSLNATFLGLIDLSRASAVLAVVAGILQFIQAKMMLPKTSSAQSGKKTDMARMMSQQMTYLMPVMTVIIGLKLPAALPLYWTTLTLFGIIQQYFTSRSVVVKEVSQS